jgi:hypothetical protein
VNQVIDKQKENTQVRANMTVVHNILNGDFEGFQPASREVELAVAA